METEIDACCYYTLNVWMLNFECLVTCSWMVSFVHAKSAVSIIAIWKFGYLTLNVRFRLLKSKFSVGLLVVEWFGYMLLKVR
jgi:hypothetical protein